MFSAKVGSNQFLPNYFGNEHLISPTSGTRRKMADDDNDESTLLSIEKNVGKNPESATSSSPTTEEIKESKTIEEIKGKEDDEEITEEEVKVQVEEEEKERNNEDEIPKIHIDEEADESPNSKRNKAIKKASVAVAGGALITVGVPLIPVLCAGELMIIGGMALLATEFNSAKNVLHKGREKLTQYALKEDEDDEEVVNKNDDYVPDDKEEEKSDANNDKNASRNLETPSNEKKSNQSSQQFARISKKFQRSMRRMVKNDILPIMDKFAPKDEVKEEEEKKESDI